MGPVVFEEILPRLMRRYALEDAKRLATCAQWLRLAPSPRHAAPMKGFEEAYRGAPLPAFGGIVAASTPGQSPLTMWFAAAIFRRRRSHEHCRESQAKPMTGCRRQGVGKRATNGMSALRGRSPRPTTKSFEKPRWRRWAYDETRSGWRSRPLCRDFGGGSPCGSGLVGQPGEMEPQFAERDRSGKISATLVPGRCRDAGSPGQPCATSWQKLAAPQRSRELQQRG